MKRIVRNRFEPREATQYTGANPSSPRTPSERIVDGKARMVVPLPKVAPLRSEPYRRWVAFLPCCHCGRAGPSQCAHGDQGKGAAIKACDSTCFPLCADAPGRRGCHSLIGASGEFSREQRRTLEARYARLVQRWAYRENQWPKDWPETGAYE